MGEGARDFGLALSRRLFAAGETVVDVAPALTVGERRAARHPGKDDRGDAVAVGRIALRERSLPRVYPEVAGTDLKLLVDARDQLVAEATGPGTVCTRCWWRSLRATRNGSVTSRPPPR